jgi:hypothetical protein
MPRNHLLVIDLIQNHDTVTLLDELQSHSCHLSQAHNLETARTQLADAPSTSLVILVFLKDINAQTLQALDTLIRDNASQTHLE